MRATEDSRTSPGGRVAELAELYGGAVYRFCWSLTYSKEDADDLFQDTFLRALEQPKISVSDNPRGFLFSTALYLWKSRKRKYARRERIAPTAPLEDTVTDSADPEADVLAREETRIVRELAEALPDKLRIPTILYYASEISVPEIARTLAIPVGTVKSRLFKARKLIQKGLEAIHYET